MGSHQAANLPLGFAGVGVDGIEGAERVDEGRSSVHRHGYAQGFGDFLLGGACFESGGGMERDATVAASGDGNGEGDQLAGFFAEKRSFGIGSGEGLVAAERVGGEFGEFRDGFAEPGLISIPIEEQGVPPGKSLVRGRSISCSTKHREEQQKISPYSAPVPGHPEWVDRSGVLRLRDLARPRTGSTRMPCHFPRDDEFAVPLRGGNPGTQAEVCITLADLERGRYTETCSERLGLRLRAGDGFD